MLKKSIKPIGILIGTIFLFYVIHKIIFEVIGCNTDTFKYSLEALYGFFALFSIVIAITLSIVKEKDLDIVGNTFLLITSAKMVVCYVFGRPIINQENLNNTLEKANFFALFMLFLLFETIFTIYLVNVKSTKKEE